MLKKRIIACLDVKNNHVIKGVKFQQHEIVGDILTLAKKYNDAGIDELVFYDITASCEKRIVDKNWIRKISAMINIPFCVAGGINSVESAAVVLANGADKISINSPAIAHPELITQLSARFGKQCVVVGIDSYEKDGQYYVYQYTGDHKKSTNTKLKTLAWAQKVEKLGAGEIVLNCMNQDGMRKGYDLKQVALLSKHLSIPIIASGGAGTVDDFVNLFKKTAASGALAATIFHKDIITINSLKQTLSKKGIKIRKC